MKKKKLIYRKIFKPGDIVILTIKNKGKLKYDSYEFLMTYKKFKVIEVNDNFNVHIGYFLDDGNIYYFSPNRFELIYGKAPLKMKNDDGVYVDTTEEEIKAIKDSMKSNEDEEEDN